MWVITYRIDISPMKTSHVVVRVGLPTLVLKFPGDLGQCPGRVDLGKGGSSAGM